MSKKNGSNGSKTSATKTAAKTATPSSRASTATDTYVVNNYIAALAEGSFKLSKRGRASEGGGKRSKEARLAALEEKRASLTPLTYLARKAAIERGRVSTTTADPEKLRQRFLEALPRVAKVRGLDAAALAAIGVPKADIAAAGLA